MGVISDISALYRIMAGCYIQGNTGARTRASPYITSVFFCLFFLSVFFLHLHKRMERPLIHNSADIRIHTIMVGFCIALIPFLLINYFAVFLS